MAVRSLEPFRLWDMEIYSTLLWHLQKNVQLSFLAQELLGIDARSPQAWIAIGNCFSLQKERGQALTCFRRAMQLDPGCAYAYALSGHETLDDNIEVAVAHFQAALRADPRHYSAWYVRRLALVACRARAREAVALSGGALIAFPPIDLLLCGS